MLDFVLSIVIKEKRRRTVKGWNIEELRKGRGKPENVIKNGGLLVHMTINSSEWK